MGFGVAKRTCFASLALMLAWPAVTRAQTGYDVPQLTPSTSGKDNLITVFSGRTLPERGYSLGVAFTWTENPLIAENPGALDPGYQPVRGRALTAQTLLHVVGAYGIFNWLELGFDLPLVLDQQAEPLSGLPQPGALDESGGVGDLRLVPRVQLLSLDRDRFPIAVRLAASLDFGLPTGSSERFQGGPFRLTPLGVIELEFPHAIRLIGNLGYTWREADIDVLGRTIGSTANVSVGLDVPIVREAGPLEAIGLVGEVFHRVSTEALAGAKVAAFGFTLFAGGGGGLNDSTGTPDARVFTTLTWGRSWGASEGDDARSEGAAAAGAAHADTDDDGYVDGVDRCPDDAEDRDGFEDADGCPDLDDDGDGITDAYDQCPREPEDRDDFRDADGCPDPDNDMDGIVDADDACPDDAEDPDGREDEDGCPDIAGDFAVDVVVFFETGTEKIPAENRYELDRLARTLAAAPPWVHVWVEGHADDRGSAELNQELSVGRARAVLNYLLARGAKSDQLSLMGFGEYYNVRPNQSDGGQRANRRVEFRVAPRASVPEGPPAGIAPLAEPGDRS